MQIFIRCVFVPATLGPLRRQSLHSTVELTGLSRFYSDKKVKTKRISGLLSMKETETYKPVGSSEILKIELG